MKKNIALVTGGFSGEAVISYKSATTILSNIDEEKWNCYWIDISPKGWFYKNAQNEFSPVDKNDFSINDKGEKIKFDAVLIGMHGTPGEDGKLQGYFNYYKINYKIPENIYDTMHKSKDIVKALNAKGQIKYPRLEELGNYYGIVNSNAHDGLADVMTTYECYKNLINDSCLEEINKLIEENIDMSDKRIESRDKFVKLCDSIFTK